MSWITLYPCLKLISSYARVFTCFLSSHWFTLPITEILISIILLTWSHLVVFKLHSSTAPVPNLWMVHTSGYPAFMSCLSAFFRPCFLLVSHLLLLPLSDLSSHLTLRSRPSLALLDLKLFAPLNRVLLSDLICMTPACFMDDPRV